MTSPNPRNALSQPGVASAVGLACSVLVHLAGVLLLSSVSTAPDLGIDFSVPAEVEFGLTEGYDVPEAPSGGEEPAAEELAAVPPPTPEPAPAREPVEEPAALPDPDAGPDASLDAGVDAEGARDAGVDADAGDSAAGDAGTGDGGDGDADGGRRDGSGDGARDGDAEERGTTGRSGPRVASAGRMPAGAQLALRMDMTKIRESPLANDIRRILAVQPDFEAVLGGSGIDPLADLDRVLIASPDPRSRSRVVIAGRHSGGEAQVRRSVESMAQENGGDASFRQEHGVAVANWNDADETDRILAMLSPEYFTVSRPQDLPAILAQARVTAEQHSLVDEAAALLEMQEGAALSITVEGARRYMQMNPPEVIPLRLEGSLTEREDQQVEVAVRARYANAREATDAVGFWEAQRDRYAVNPMVNLIGMAEPLYDMTFEAEGAEVVATTELSPRQLRFLLSQVESIFREWARGTRPTPSTSSMASPSTTSPSMTSPSMTSPSMASPAASMTPSMAPASMSSSSAGSASSLGVPAPR
ncbi:MAG: hypothetical protein AAGF12_33975 [Myxococcota bacterium]